MSLAEYLEIDEYILPMQKGMIEIIKQTGDRGEIIIGIRDFPICLENKGNYMIIYPN